MSTTIQCEEISMKPCPNCKNPKPFTLYTCEGHSYRWLEYNDSCDGTTIVCCNECEDMILSFSFSKCQLCQEHGTKTFICYKCSNGYCSGCTRIICSNETCLSFSCHDCGYEVCVDCEENSFFCERCVNKFCAGCSEEFNEYCPSCTKENDEPTEE